MPPGFNALAGIFAFRTWHKPLRIASANKQVSMPSRAFLLFGRKRRHGARRGGRWFQCPRGHSCFSDGASVRSFALRLTVSMPSRAFLLFGPTPPSRNHPARICVSMPSRAFLLFGRSIRSRIPPPTWVSMPSRAFLLFGRMVRRLVWSVEVLFQCPRGHFCFSDRYLRRWKRASHW